MEAAPYDNVEFGPLYRGTTGTWPGPQGQQQSLVTQQQTARGLQQTKGIGAGAANRLAPLEESNAEVAETRDQRSQAVTQHASSFASSSSSSSQAQRSATSGFSASSGTSAFPGVGSRPANSGVSWKFMSVYAGGAGGDGAVQNGGEGRGEVSADGG